MIQTTFDYGEAQPEGDQRSSFDYGALDEETRLFVKAKALAIQTRLKRAAEDIIAIGLDLREVQERLSRHHGGEFGAWLELEFEMSYRTGYRFMQVAQRFAGSFDKLSRLSASVLYELAAPSTSDEVVDKVLLGEIEASLSAVKAEKEAEKQRADNAEQERRVVESQLQLLREEVATLQRQVEERPQVVDDPETEAALIQLQQDYAEKERQLKQKSERVEVLTEELRRLAQRDEQETYREQVRIKWRRACESLHQGVKEGLARMVTPLDARSAFEADEWARLAEVEIALKRVLSELSHLQEQGQVIEAKGWE
jgi:hypothetical protein